MQKRTCTFLVAIGLPLAFPAAASIAPKNFSDRFPKFYFPMPPQPVTVTDDEPSALRELKETVKRQAEEIEELKKAVSRKQQPPSHAGHASPALDDDIASYVSSPFYRVAFKRVTWLSVFLGSLSLTALIMNRFEHTLSQQIELAFFVPLLAGHGGNTGGQTVGTVLSAMSTGAITKKDAFRVISKEAASGLTVGLILGAVVGLVSHHVMGISSHVATVVACTIPITSTVASTLASTIPYLCAVVGLDPAVIAAPAMTTFVDVSGILTYFLIANRVFKIYGLEL